MTPAQKDRLDQREIRARKVIQGPKVTREKRERLEPKVTPEKRETPGQKETPATSPTYQR